MCPDAPDAALPRAGREASGSGIGCLLAFDTSTESMAVALQTPAGLSTWNGEGGAASSALLLPRIRQMLDRAGIGLGQLQAIAFGAGPGAFTGLRTACAVAQGLAFGASLPVVPVDSLLIVAEGARGRHPAAAEQVDVVMDARMGEVYAGRYRWTGQRWQVLQAPVLAGLEALHRLWSDETPVAVAGSALAAFGERMRTGSAARIDADIDRAAALMRVAQLNWRDVGGIDPALALPLYLRDKVALTVAEREAARVGT
jgi:tRNA threonylcarbamoyladenosine biosynthesis protein TsaB